MFLGWQRSQGLDGKEHDFYIRQLWDWKASMDLSTMRYWGLHAYSRACGWSLARAHARSGDRLCDRVPISAAARTSTRRSRVSRAAYADQNELDYERLIEAVHAGEVPAQFNV